MCDSADASSVEALEFDFGGVFSIFASLLEGKAVTKVIHEKGNHDGQNKIDQHQNGDALHGPSRLVESGVSNAHQVGETNGYGKRGVLDQIQVLVGEGRQDESCGLRQYDPSVDLCGLESYALSGQNLSLGYRGDARTNDLCDECTCVNAQCHQDG